MRLIAFLLVLCLTIGAIPAVPLLAAADTPTTHQTQLEYEPYETGYKYIVAIIFDYEPYQTDYKYTIVVALFDYTDCQHPLAVFALTINYYTGFATLALTINGYTEFVSWYWNLYTH